MHHSLVIDLLNVQYQHVRALANALPVFRDSVFCNVTLEVFFTYVTIMEIHSPTN